MSTQEDFNVLKPVISREYVPVTQYTTRKQLGLTSTRANKGVTNNSKYEPRQRNAANGGGEPPSTQVVADAMLSMLDGWKEEYDGANLSVSEVLFAKARSRALPLLEARRRWL
jgi:hypothetical protein